MGESRSLPYVFPFATPATSRRSTPRHPYPWTDILSIPTLGSSLRICRPVIYTYPALELLLLPLSRALSSRRDTPSSSDDTTRVRSRRRPSSRRASRPLPRTRREPSATGLRRRATTLAPTAERRRTPSGSLGRGSYRTLRSRRPRRMVLSSSSRYVPARLCVSKAPLYRRLSLALVLNLSPFPCRLSPRLTLTLLRPTASRNVRRRRPSR